MRYRFLQSLTRSIYDIIGRVSLSPSINPNDRELTAGLLRNLFTERFNLKYHKEERPVTAYQLAAAKPKLSALLDYRPACSESDEES